MSSVKALDQLRGATTRRGPNERYGEWVGDLYRIVKSYCALAHRLGETIRARRDNDWSWFRNRLRLIDESMFRLVLPSNISDLVSGSGLTDLAQIRDWLMGHDEIAAWDPGNVRMVTACFWFRSKINRAIELFERPGDPSAEEVIDAYGYLMAISGDQADE